MQIVIVFKLPIQIKFPAHEISSTTNVTNVDLLK